VQLYIYNIYKIHISSSFLIYIYIYYIYIYYCFVCTSMFTYVHIYVFTFPRFHWTIHLPCYLHIYVRIHIFTDLFTYFPTTHVLVNQVREAARSHPARAASHVGFSTQRRPWEASLCSMAFIPVGPGNQASRLICVGRVISHGIKHTPIGRPQP